MSDVHLSLSRSNGYLPLCLFPEIFFKMLPALLVLFFLTCFASYHSSADSPGKFYSIQKNFFFQCCLFINLFFILFYLESSTTLSSFFESQNIESWVSCIFVFFYTWYAAFSLTEEYRKQFVRYYYSSNLSAVVSRFCQCCVSMTFWCGSGSADPCL